MYTESEARNLIIEAGKKLIEEKLIARTWGNISAKISDTEFIITPSGKPYDTLKPNELVKVNINDLSYSGDIKPSSEKGIHAIAYKYNININFIVHTHQDYATAISIEKNDFSFAPNCKYGLPGTKKLMKNVEAKIKENLNCKAFLLARHGALLLGNDYLDAFNQAKILEENAKKEYESKYKEKDINKPYLDDYAQMFGYKDKAIDEDIEAINIIKNKNKLAINYSTKSKPMNCFDVMLQHFVYKKKYSKLKNK